MSLSPSVKFKEQSPVEIEKMRQCYVCDRHFRTRKELLVHRKLYHNQVVVFEISRDNNQVYGFSNSWKIPNFDDLFFYEDACSKTNFHDNKKKIICKLRKHPKISTTKVDIGAKRKANKEKVL